MRGSAVLEPGAIFARDYRVVRPLAEGGMGAVYVADQLSTGKTRALKLMHPEIAADPDARRRFEQEARIGARIHSDHVVEVQAAGVDDETGAPYLVMELLVGEDLASRVNRAGPLAPAEAADVLEQLCHAIAAAHEAGVVHRDLKPENVFLADVRRAGEARRHVKVLDFGIAKVVADATAKGATTVGMIGTPLWMAPEQTEKGPITAAADVWAIGLIAYYLLTGKHFWNTASDPSSTMAQLIREIVIQPIPDATVRARAQGVAARLPMHFDAVFARCVARSPAERFATAAELGHALLPMLSGFQRTMPKPEPSSARGVSAAAGALAHAQTEVAPRGVQPSSPITAVARPERLPDALGGDLAGANPMVLRGAIVGGGILLSLVGYIYLQTVRNRAIEAAAHEGESLPVLPADARSLAAPTCRSACVTSATILSGALDDKVLGFAIEREADALQQCTVGGRKHWSSQPGELVAEFEVSGGHPSNVRISQSSFSAGGVDECVESTLRGVRLAQGTDGAQARVALRIVPPARSR